MDCRYGAVSIGRRDRGRLTGWEVCTRYQWSVVHNILDVRTEILCVREFREGSEALEVLVV
jgi:hypothetical protein